MKNNTDEYLVKEDDKKYSFKEKCTRCLKGPKQIIRSIVLLTCCIVVIYQIAVCMSKIRNPPISTYSHFDFNDTIHYPAVTVCRDPPYKADVLEEYGLYGHPRYTSEWKYFPFETANLKDFWEESTYNIKDNFLGLSLNHSIENIKIESTLNFLLGQCQTIRPTSEITTALKETGFSIILNHSLTDMDTTTSTIPPGYHVYIHQSDEPFTEHTAAFLAEYLYVNVGEEIDVKLTVQEMYVLPDGPAICEQDFDYRPSKCAQQCRTNRLEETVGCKGPWMDSTLPDCSNYTDMKNLIISYISMTNELNDCNSCIRHCNSKIYQGFVVDRNSYVLWDNVKGKKPISELEKCQTQLYIYFNNKMVSIYEETHNYDWSLFLADCGGSLGFLLGLSVIGVITLLEDIFEIVVHPFLPKKRDTYKDETISARSDWTIRKNKEMEDKIEDDCKNDIPKDFKKFDTPFGEKAFYIE